MSWTLLLRMVVCLLPLHAAALPASDCRGLECIRGQTTSSSPPPLSSFPSSFLSSFPSSFPSSSSVVVVSSSRRSLDQLVPGTPPNDGERKHRDGGAVLPFVGLTGSAQQSRRCCKNGGTCILGSFCACPPFFSGRICEYDERIRSCGPIPHGIWVQKGCSYCRCGYGLLHCFPHVFHKDCDDSEEVRWYGSSAVDVNPTGWFLYLTLLLPLLLL